MTKAELLKQLEGIDDNDELKFYKTTHYYCEDPDDTFGGDTCSRDEYVEVDGVTKDFLRKNSYRIIRVSFASNRIYCMKPFGSYDKYIYDPITKFALENMNYMSFKKSFRTQEELENYLKEFPLVGKKTGKVLSVENIVWNDDDLEEN